MQRTAAWRRHQRQVHIARRIRHLRVKGVRPYAYPGYPEQSGRNAKHFCFRWLHEDRSDPGMNGCFKAKGFSPPVWDDMHPVVSTRQLLKRDTERQLQDAA